MSSHNPLTVVRLSSTLRFVQGYHCLDRCGAALIRLENTTDEGWIPGDITASRGHLHNWRLGMRAQFNSERMTVHQTEYISFDHFQDQTCKIYEVLWQTFDLKTILTPSLQVILQIGFEELADANTYALKLRLCEPEKALLSALGGEQSAVGYTICTESNAVRDGSLIVDRHRFEFNVVRQERQPDFDERVLRRLPLLPVGHQEALGHLMRLRRRYPKIAPVAVQFDLESSCEGELLTRTFRLSTFLQDSWEWVGTVQERLQTLQPESVKR